MHDNADTEMNGAAVRPSTELQDVARQNSLPSEPTAGPATSSPFADSFVKMFPPLRGEGVKREDTSDLEATLRRDPPRPAKYDKLSYSTSQTGLVYDVRMRFHVEPEPEADDIHPEDPRRIHAIFEAFVDAGLAWGGVHSPSPPNDFQMGRIDARMVTKQEVCLVHTESHWEWVQQLRHKTAKELVYERQHEGADMDSVYMSPNTPYCADLSAGGAIEACRAVMLGKVKNVFAVIRPPGHHAEREDAKGFCFYDNVSIATKVCQLEFGDRCRRVFILDWDVHHGNGIQQANYDDPNVLYVSLHVHEQGLFYPELSYRDKRRSYGDHLHCGNDAGLGRNVNIPWRTKGMGDADYIYAFQQVVMPIATEFDPDLVIIAAGFDAAEGDMLGRCNVTPAGYAHMTHMLMSLAQGRVAVCLEGGYNLDAIARSACAVGRTLMGEPPDRLRDLDPSKTAVDDVKLVLRQQSKFWKCLYPKDMSARLAGPLHGERVDHVVRKWQAITLWDEYEMSPLFVHRDRLSKSFENQVLATPNYMEGRPLLVILHDPPEMLASPDPRTGRVALHNTWLADSIKTYVDWAVKESFGVIDVNLPKLAVYADSDTNEHEAQQELETRIAEVTDLLTYLWDNYIELNESEQIFLMGTNIGHAAILSFVKTNEERARDRVSKIISFVEDTPLRALRSLTATDLDYWYREHSLTFVAHNHYFWNNQELSARKPKRKFGRPVRCEDDGISDMLVAHKPDVVAALLAETTGWRSNETSHQDKYMADAMGVDVTPAAGGFLSSPPRSAAPTSTFAGSEPRQSTLESPTKLPPIANFALSPSKRPPVPRSPAR